MTRHDIIALSEVTHSLRSQISDEQFVEFIGRVLWAIHQSHRNPRFDEQKFRAACRGDGEFSEIFRAD